MNIINAIILLLICSLIGVIKSSQIKNRQTQLNEILIMTQRIKTYIKSEQIKTHDIINKLAKDESFSKLDFLKRCQSDFTYSKQFDALWRESVKNTKAKLNLAENEIKTLEMLGGIIGNGDATTQLKGLEMVEKLLQESLVDAKENVKTKGKLYRSLGVLCGIAIAIVVI